MKEVAFTKMHGAGNDFIVIDNRDGTLRFVPSLIKALCARRNGVGADGLILIGESSTADFSMRYYNSDGNEAELCGNGARCTALFANSNGIAGKEMSFETAAGILTASVEGEEIRLSITDVTDIRTGLELSGIDEPVGFGVCGVPHAMIISRDVDSMEYGEFIELGKKVRYHEKFSPEGTNFNLVEVLDEHKLRYRTYERGVEDETLACGTGAVSTAVLCARLGLVSSPVSCFTSGGDTLKVTFEMQGDRAVGCTLTGPAVIVFEGRLDLENFR